MTRTRFSLTALCFFAFARVLVAQQQPAWEIESLTGEGGVEYDWQKEIATATNGVIVKYGNGVLTAAKVVVNLATGEVTAEGQVRIQRDDQVWASEQVGYNFKTGKFGAQQFRTGKSPVFAAGEGLQAEVRQPRLLAALKPDGQTQTAPGLIAAAPERIRARDKIGAERVVEAASSFPAQASQVTPGSTADLNQDGFITGDELVALKQAGLTEAQIVQRIEATGQVFDLRPEDRAWLWSNGMEANLVDALEGLNPAARASLEPGKPRFGPRQGNSARSASAYVYTATNAIITADDVSKPLLKVRAKYIRITPGQKSKPVMPCSTPGKFRFFIFHFTAAASKNMGTTLIFNLGIAAAMVLTC